MCSKLGTSKNDYGKNRKEEPVVLQEFLIRSLQLFTNVGLEFHTMQFDLAEQRMPNVATHKQDKYKWEVAHI